MRWHFRDLDVCEDIWDRRLEIVSLQCLRTQYQIRGTHLIPPVGEETTDQRDVTVSPVGLEPIPGPPCPQMVGCCCWVGGEEVVFREANQGVLWEGGCLLKKPVFKIKQFSLASLPHGRRKAASAPALLDNFSTDTLVKAGLTLDAQPPAPGQDVDPSAISSLAPAKIGC